MTSSRSRVVRAVGALAVLLLAGLVPVTPAAAAPTPAPVAAFSLDARAGASPGGTPVLPTENGIAYLGPAPASMTVVADLVNTGTDALTDVTVAYEVVTNGHLDASRCAVSPASASSAATTDPDDGDSVTWTDPGLVLEPGQRLRCLFDVSGAVEKLRYHDTTRATAVGVLTRETVSWRSDVYGLAGESNPPPAPAVAIGYAVWLDANANGVRDAGEPGIPGLRLSITTGLRPQPARDYLTGAVVGPRTTDADGSFRFRQLRPSSTYNVTLDLDDPALAELMPTSGSAGYDPVGGTWMQRVGVQEWDLDEPGFAFKRKQPVTLTLDAPTRSAVAGTTVQLTSHADQPGLGYWWTGRGFLEFRAGGTSTWTRVTEPVQNYRGTWKPTVTATRSGWYRFRSTGDSVTAAAVSPERHLLVVTAPVTLTSAAPTTVRHGNPLTVTGTITRAGKPFATGRIVLERSTGATTWTTVADVRSTDGTLRASVDSARAGAYRFRYAGDSRTSSGTSPARSVVIA